MFGNLKLAVAVLSVVAAWGASGRADGELEVFVEHGKLVILGDKADNSLVVHSYAPGDFTLTSDDTEMNGKKKLAFQGIEGLSISLYDGDDSIEFRGNDVVPNVPKKLFLYMGSGSDNVVFNEFHVGDEAWMYLDEFNDEGKPGDDHFEAHQLNVYGFMGLQAGLGMDEITFDVEDTAFHYNTALAGARIDLGPKDEVGNKLSMESFFTWEGLEVVGSQGVDLIDMIDVLVYADDLVIDLADGNDELTVQDAHMMWATTDHPTSIYVSTEGGQNTMEFANVSTRGNIGIQGSRGRDGADFVHCEIAGMLLFDGGTADDMLFVRFSNAQFHSLDGGAGDGDLLWLISEDLGFGVISGFESN
ncbi:MAG: hypothetical protein AB8B50_13280 [Pirellulaceae bacterium]